MNGKPLNLFTRIQGFYLLKITAILHAYRAKKTR